MPAGKRSRQQRSQPPVSDPQAAAAAANLVYVSDADPGIRRKKASKGFRYLLPDGQPVKDKATLARIEALAIPPAYQTVWISLAADGHMQATGRDDKGRKQYRYHARWQEQRAGTKFERMILFGEALPALRQQLQADLRRHGLPREKVLAAVISLLGKTFIRVGNAEYARTNESYGLTTLQDDHADITGSLMTFTFRGKSGKDHDITLRDRRLAKVVRESQDLPGQHLFQYMDADKTVHAINSTDVNTYLHTISGQSFTAKDFRTWGGTTLAVRTCATLEPADDLSDHAGKKQITRMLKAVAAELGNTPSVCRKYYVHPVVGEAYLAGRLLPMLDAETGVGETADPYDLDAAERVVIRLLRAVRDSA